MYVIGSKSMLRGPQLTRDQFLRDTLIKLSNAYFEVYLFLHYTSNLVKNNQGTSLIGDVFASCDRISN